MVGLLIISEKVIYGLKNKKYLYDLYILAKNFVYSFLY